MKVIPTYTEKDYKFAKESSKNKPTDRVLPRKYAVMWGEMIDNIVERHKEIHMSTCFV